MPGIGGLRFRLLTGRWAADDPPAVQRRELGREALAMLERHLADRSFLVGDRYTIADISVYAYTHTAGEAGFDLDEFPAVAGWLRRVEEQPRFMNDLAPYPENARPGAGSSTYG
jgi:glutathione S-transferase